MSSARRRLGRCLPPVLTAVVLAALAAPPAEAQNEIFDDSFESGDTGGWSSTEPPLLQNCNCYFSNDCTGGHFCFWGPAGPFTEDICGWRVPKPNGTPGVGCDADHDGPWGAICDGYCTPTSAGSPVGWVDPTLGAVAVPLWGEAMLAPAAAGGGPIDPELAAAAEAIGFASPHVSKMVGREAAAVLALASGFSFYDYFCHWDHGDTDPSWFPSLAGDPCRVAAGRLALEALVAAVRGEPGGVGAMDQIPIFCPGWPTMFTPTCDAGRDALACARGRVADIAEALTTPDLLHPPVRGLR
jgi:hypothetical protein